MAPSFGNVVFPPNAADDVICSEHPYEMFCLFPSLSPFYTHFEKTFSGFDMAAWFARNVWIPLVLAALYLAGCYFGQQYMKDRPAFQLKTSLAAWNLGLSVFSFIAVLRVVPHLWYYIWLEGVDYTICAPSPLWFGNGTQAFWVFMFVASKIPELIDTAFIVLRKRKLIFLHWYHHTTVLVVCWYAGSTMQSSGLWFVAMNFSVHSVMYFYYFLSAIGHRVSWASLVTAMQIAQMFAGCWICVKIQLAKWRGLPCAITPFCHLLTCAMYGSYLYLFVRFAWFRFGPGKKSASAAPKLRAGASTNDTVLLSNGATAAANLKHRSTATATANGTAGPDLEVGAGASTNKRRD